MKLGQDELSEFGRRFDKLRAVTGEPKNLSQLEFQELSGDTIAAADSVLDWFNETGFLLRSSVSADRIVQSAPPGFRHALKAYRENWESHMRVFAEKPREQIDIGFIAYRVRSLTRESDDVFPSIDANQDSFFRPSVHALADCISILQFAGPRPTDNIEEQNMYEVALGGVDHLFRRMDTTPSEWDERDSKLKLIVIEESELGKAPRLTALLLDAMRAYLFGAFLACSVSCRACAEVLLEARFKARGRPLKENLMELINDAPPWARWDATKDELHKLRKLGNDAAHSTSEEAIGEAEAFGCLEVVQKLLRAR